MARFKASQKWVETGYALVAGEGLEHVQVEKMARTLGLNKSGFYHYFGTLEIFLEQLVLFHASKIDLLATDIQNCQKVDPDVVNIALKHKVTLLAQVQLVRNKTNPLFCSVVDTSDQKIEHAILPVWAEHTGLLNNYGLASRYFRFVRDIFYTRISHQNFNYFFLHALATEAKEIVEDILKESPSLKNLVISKQS